MAKATDAARKADLQGNLAQAESYLAELKAMHVTLPSLTFDRSFTINDKARTVQILWLGKAHTDGDVFVYLPRERFIATGTRSTGGRRSWPMVTRTTGSVRSRPPSNWTSTTRSAATATCFEGRRSSRCGSST